MVYTFRFWTPRHWRQGRFLLLVFLRWNSPKGMRSQGATDWAGYTGREKSGQELDLSSLLEISYKKQYVINVV